MVAAVARGGGLIANGVRGAGGWRGHGRRLTVTRGDVVRLASARVSVSEACNDDGRADTANQSAHYTNSIDVVVDPDVAGRSFDNRRVALASSRTPGAILSSLLFGFILANRAAFKQGLCESANS